MINFQTATLVGCAIGDALGNPFEMKPAISPSLTTWDALFKAGGTFWKGDAGQYTDDTLMSIALSKSIIQSTGFDPKDVANEYLNWYLSKNTRGIGTTTATALENLKLGYSWEQSGLISSRSGGNGTAMRAAPIGLVYRNKLNLVLKYAVEDASITHNSLEPKMGSCAIALATAILTDRDVGTIAMSSLLGNIISVLLDSEVKSKLQDVQKALHEKIDPKVVLASIGTSGYVPESVGAAFYCLLATSSFEDAVVMAVRGGGDTDTIAAMTGAMAGTYYGLDGIPEHYKSVENFDLLTSLDRELINIDI